MAKVYKNANAKVAHKSGVVAAVHDKGSEIASQARANLSTHKDTGATEVQYFTVDTDAIVALVDTGKVPATAAIEYGHTARDGSHVEGLYILHEAAGLAH